MVAGSNPDIWCTEEEENILFMVMLGYKCSIWLDVQYTALSFCNMFRFLTYNVES